MPHFSASCRATQLRLRCGRVSRCEPYGDRHEDEGVADRLQVAVFQIGIERPGADDVEAVLRRGASGGADNAGLDGNPVARPKVRVEAEPVNPRALAADDAPVSIHRDVVVVQQVHAQDHVVASGLIGQQHHIEISTDGGRHDGPSFLVCL